jgi:hypothetical protein
MSRKKKVHSKNGERRILEACETPTWVLGARDLHEDGLGAWFFSVRKVPQKEIWWVGLKLTCVGLGHARWRAMVHDLRGYAVPMLCVLW